MGPLTPKDWGAFLGFSLKVTQMEGMGEGRA